MPYKGKAVGGMKMPMGYMKDPMFKHLGHMASDKVMQEGHNNFGVAMMMSAVPKRKKSRAGKKSKGY